MIIFYEKNKLSSNIRMYSIVIDSNSDLSLPIFPSLRAINIYKLLKKKYKCILHGNSREILEGDIYIYCGYEYNNAIFYKSSYFKKLKTYKFNKYYCIQDFYYSKMRHQQAWFTENGGVLTHTNSKYNKCIGYGFNSKYNFNKKNKSLTINIVIDFPHQKFTLRKAQIFNTALNNIKLLLLLNQYQKKNV